MQSNLVGNLLVLLLAACGGKKSPTPTNGAGSAGASRIVEPKASKGSASPEKPTETPDEDPCAVPVPH